VTVPGNIGEENPSRYEWAVTTTPQRFLDNATRTFNQGRVVGGSTVTNGLCWTRGSAADYDAWENLGNPGWGWEGLLPYFLKVWDRERRSVSGND
jgi:choline dehydrogenase